MPGLPSSLPELSSATGNMEEFKGKAQHQEATVEIISLRDFFTHGQMGYDCGKNSHMDAEESYAEGFRVFPPSKLGAFLCNTALHWLPFWGCILFLILTWNRKTDLNNLRETAHTKLPNSLSLWPTPSLITLSLSHSLELLPPPISICCTWIQFLKQLSRANYGLKWAGQITILFCFVFHLTHHNELSSNPSYNKY